MSGRIKYRNIVPAILLAFITSGALAQDIQYDSLLQRIDTIENPVYKPVLSVGYGVLNFLGDVKNSYRIPVIGNPAARVNVSTFIDNQHHITANFFFMTGNLTGNQSSLTDLNQNLNFSTNIYSIGVNARYSFGHLISEEMRLKPYVSLGVEQINFSTKGDIADDEGNIYHYWPDGSIRTAGVSDEGAALPTFRDYIYETDLRSYEKDNYDLGNYTPRAIGLPLEIGMALSISERVYLSLGIELHYVFSDYIDNVAAQGTYHVGNPGNDMYTFSNLSLHFDLFSDPETRTVELMFADIELDPILFDDEDGDFVLDIADRCPGTPYGVVVDTTGCPLDGDNDGVADYLDKEDNTAPGAWVDEEGVNLEEDDFLAMLQRDEALDREDLDAYMAMFEQTFKDMEITEIPDKFVEVDTDEDGYISFDELLSAIDEYFDFEVSLSLEELRQLNEFFFSQ